MADFLVIVKCLFERILEVRQVSILLLPQKPAVFVSTSQGDSLVLSVSGVASVVLTGIVLLCWRISGECRSHILKRHHQRLEE
ncbi:hypothetical protein KOR42_54090 [Thalassoglobus neptunius]|uniref:Uncharacterized protein n=1 Tax=Thalassoglobus neptunius TaxID=1938619 RepID=A0A5C5UYM7_9PLAN|nr:hypothetical protein KOR42_54090 [Thalassoglobus neptunius]